ncbi:glycosyltransferase family 2 protein [Paenibacillus nasutitermitis]|uniref:glycosyltransferase family 2 protein n=1 Tax=Paenibacillus nasutitermitis TaxID=1652958 RepID=UPI001667E7E4|nr:glycosyltransferase [Paenibacillus nasutitermitis]
MPVRDEKKNIGRLLASLAKKMWSQYEMIVVDDGSTDQTAAIAAHLAQRSCSQASCLQSGWAQARRAGRAPGRRKGYADIFWMRIPSWSQKAS